MRIVFSFTCPGRLTIDLMRSTRTPLCSEHTKQYDAYSCKALSHSERKQCEDCIPPCAVEDGEKAVRASIKLIWQFMAVLYIPYRKHLRFFKFVRLKTLLSQINLTFYQTIRCSHNWPLEITHNSSTEKPNVIGWWFRTATYRLILLEKNNTNVKVMAVNVRLW